MEVICNLLLNLEALPLADIDSYKEAKEKLRYKTYGPEKNKELAELYATYINNTQEGAIIDVFVKIMCLMAEKSIDISTLQNEFIRFKQHGKK